jgi:hypothetical protein
LRSLFALRADYPSGAVRHYRRLEKKEKFPVISLKSREFGGAGCSVDGIHRRLVSLENQPLDYGASRAMKDSHRRRSWGAGVANSLLGSSEVLFHPPRISVVANTTVRRAMGGGTIGVLLNHLINARLTWIRQAHRVTEKIRGARSGRESAHSDPDDEAATESCISISNRAPKERHYLPRVRKPSRSGPWKSVSFLKFREQYVLKIAAIRRAQLVPAWQPAQIRKVNGEHNETDIPTDDQRSAFCQLGSSPNWLNRH